MDKALALRVVTALQDKLAGPLSKIKGEAAASGKEMVALRDRLRTLNATQRDIGEFRGLSAGLRGARSELAAAQERVGQLSRQMRDTQNPTREMRREFDRAVATAGRLKDAAAQQSVRLQELRSRLSAAGVSTGNLSSHERELRQNIGQTNQALAQQAARLKAVAERQERQARARTALERGRSVAGSAAVAGAGGLGGAYALSRPLSAVVGAFAPAEDAATQLKVALMGSDGTVAADFQRISDLATQLGDKLPGTTADFQNMMTMLRRQGMSSATILGGLGKATAYLGVLLKMPVTEAAEFAAKMQDATRTSEKDMMGLMDVIQRTFYIGVDSNNMLQGFTKLSPVLGIIGREGLEASKMLAPLLVMMDQTGMVGESAGNALRKVFQAGLDADKVGKANALLATQGFKLDFTDGKGEFGGLDQLFAQLDRLKSLTSVQRTSVLKALFGDDAETLQVVNTLMAKGVAGYKDVVTRMQEQGDLQKRVDEQLQTLANTAEAAEGSFTNALATVGATVAPQLKELLNWAGDLAARFGEWARANPVLVGTLVKILAVATGLAAAFGGLALAFASVVGPMALTRFMFAQIGIALPSVASLFGLLARAVGGVGSAVVAVGRALLTNPLMLALTGIAVAAYLIYQYWEPIRAFFIGLWDSVKQAFSGGLAGVGALLADWSPMGLLYRAISAGLSALGVELPAKFSEFGSMLIQGLINGITSMGGAVKDTISNLGGGMVDWFKEKLGIRSPSRVFMAQGEFVSQGAAAGIRNAQPAAIRAAQALAASVAIGGALAPVSPVLADSGAPGGVIAAQGAGPFDTRPALPPAEARQVIVQGDTIQITISPAAGMSADDIGRAVEDALRRRDREKAARVRSAYLDDA
ncbi:phage tail tape measure protein [Bordetella genomosp. 9]|uniref:Phage tail tape measure protein n=1 Tax=Bordetella genomosp. 9 TaxID=1416803 RepID=A0A261RQG4_9BORD|nr:phage tail tape measure protein [Bordetella genomosp. 9]OZI26840.1 phage tail tape measure protein [Bordetella genomosp. 9]